MEAFVEAAYRNHYPCHRFLLLHQNESTLFKQSASWEDFPDGRTEKNNRKDDDDGKESIRTIGFYFYS